MPLVAVVLDRLDLTAADGHRLAKPSETSTSQALAPHFAAWTGHPGRVAAGFPDDGRSDGCRVRGMDRGSRIVPGSRTGQVAGQEPRQCASQQAVPCILHSRRKSLSAAARQQHPPGTPWPTSPTPRRQRTLSKTRKAADAGAAGSWGGTCRVIDRPAEEDRHPGEPARRCRRRNE